MSSIVNQNDLIGNAIIRLNNIFNLKFIQDQTNIKSPFYTSVIIETIILLNYLLEQADIKSVGLTFNTDIKEYIGTGRQKSHSYNDITTLLYFFRNAICHPDAITRFETFDKNGVVSFFYQKGTESNSGITHHCKFNDDIAILMGDHVLYVIRHIKRAYDEVSEKLLSLNQLHVYKMLLDRITKNKS